MFRGMIALAPADLSIECKDLIAKHGGTVVHKALEGVDCVVVNDGDSAEKVAAHQSMRARRIPTVYCRWVHDCVSAGRILPRAGRHHCDYDPFWLRGHVVTTSLLNSVERRNISACVRFYGGSYERHLTVHTTLLICGGTVSAKVQEAVQRDVFCETVDWFQRCADTGTLQPFSNRHCNELAVELVNDVLRLPPERSGEKEIQRENSPSVGGPPSSGHWTKIDGELFRTPQKAKENVLSAHAKSVVTRLSAPPNGEGSPSIDMPLQKKGQEPKESATDQTIAANEKLRRLVARSASALQHSVPASRSPSCITGSTRKPFVNPAPRSSPEENRTKSSGTDSGAMIRKRSRELVATVEEQLTWVSPEKRKPPLKPTDVLEPTSTRGTGARTALVAPPKRNSHKKVAPAATQQPPGRSSGGKGAQKQASSSQKNKKRKQRRY